MTDALPYQGGSSGAPSFGLVESKRPSLFAVGFAGVFALLFGLLLFVGMDYEMRHPMAMPWARGKIEEPKAAGPVAPEVVFSCSVVRGGSVRVVARVQQLPGLPAPSGQVRFLIGYETLKFVKVEGGVATATVKLSKSQSGATFRALYLGDDFYGSSFSNTGSVVGK